jgi:4-amino-4-deoxy-L-arabinose transferase-like glycosyltransferase
MRLAWPFDLGPDGDLDAPSWTRGEKLAAGATVAVLLASLAVLTHPWYDPKNDSSVYIATARSLLAGEGYQYLGAPLSVRPPGFSALIAPVIAAFDVDFFALNLYVNLFALASVLLLYLYQRNRVPWIVALTTAWAIWLNPGFRRFSGQVMSDTPGLALLLACLLIDRWARSRTSTRREALLGVAVGLSAYVRSANLLLIPAIALSRLLQRSGTGATPVSWAGFVARRLAVFAAVAIALQVPWSIRNQLHPPPAPSDQIALHSYWTGMLHEDKSDPDSPLLGVVGILERVPYQTSRIAIGLASRLTRDKSASRYPLMALPFALAWLLCLVRRRGTAEFFVAGTLLLLALYIGYQNRLLLPAYVLMFAASAEILWDVSRRAAGTTAASVITAVALLASIAVDFDPRPRWDEIERNHHRWSKIARTLSKDLPAESCLASARGFHYGLYMDRPVYSMLPMVRHVGDASGAEWVIDRYGVDTVVLSPRRDADKLLLPYFEEHYGPGRTVAALRSFRVRPPAAGCRHREG